MSLHPTLGAVSFDLPLQNRAIDKIFFSRWRADFGMIVRPYYNRHKHKFSELKVESGHMAVNFIFIKKQYWQGCYFKQLYIKRLKDDYAKT